MAISEVFAINFTQPTSTMITYVLTIEQRNLASAPISQFVAIKLKLCHVALPML